MPNKPQLSNDLTNSPHIHAPSPSEIGHGERAPKQPPPLPTPQPALTTRPNPVLSYLNLLGPTLALIIVYAAFAIAQPGMLRAIAIEQIITQAVLVGTAAVGMTLVIIAGGIDLSVGSTIALGSVICAKLVAEANLPPTIAALLAITACALLGLANGLAIVLLKMTPFIVTLGTMLAYRGIAKGLASSTMVNLNNNPFDSLMTKPTGSAAFLLMPIGAWLMIALTILAALFLRYARLGRHVVAVGSNEQTARLCGVRVHLVKLFVYALLGATAGVSGLILVSLQSQGDPTAALGLELDIIAAVVIGGGSLAGGQGSAFGTLVGALIMSVLKTGCTFVGWDNWVQQLTTGIVIVVAVAIDRLRRPQST